MFFINNISSNRFLFFIYFSFIYFFVYRSFHAITEEVCVSICVVGFLCLLLYYMTGKGLLAFQKSWYQRFLQKIDVVLLSLTSLHGIFYFIFSDKQLTNLNLLDFYIFFLNFFKNNISSYYAFNITSLELFYNNIFLFKNKDRQLIGSKHINRVNLTQLLD